MANDWLRVRFLYTEELDSEFIEELLNHCLDIGCSTKRDGTTDECVYELSDNSIHQDAPTSEGINTIAQSGQGRIELWCDEIRIYLNINPNDRNIRDSLPLVSASIMNSQFKVSDKSLEEEVQGRVNQMIDFAVSIVEFTDSDFAYGTTESADRPLDVTWTDLVDGRPPARLQWLSVFSDKMVDRFGRQRVENAPAWEVRELETGDVLVVVSNNPVYPAEEWSGSYSAVAKHLGRAIEPS